MPINELLTFDVSFGGSVRASATATINDTSTSAFEYMLVPGNPSTTPITEIDIPTYVLSSNANSVNEGAAVTITLTTTKLDTGTKVPYAITGIQLEDVTLTSLSGDFVTDSTGKATLVITTVADAKTEGNEIMVISCPGTTATKSVTVNDTSRTPVYDLGFHKNNIGTNLASSTNEGSALYLVMKTDAVDDGVVIDITLSGTGITSADFIKNNPLTDTMTMYRSLAYIDCAISGDRLTEGAETLVATAKRDGVVVATASIVINDTSLTMSYDYGVYNAAGNAINEITVIDEGPAPTPNNTYHHKSGLSEFVLGANTAKRIVIYPADTAPANAEWDGASGGMTGLYVPVDGQTPVYGGWVGASGPSGLYVNGTAAMFGNFGYNNYDRNNGGADTWAYGYWAWGSEHVRGYVGLTGVYDGVRITVEKIDANNSLYLYSSGDGGLLYAPVITVKIENTNAVSKTLYTMFGEKATGGGWGMSGTGNGEHGVNGGTLIHGVGDTNYIDRDFVATWKSGATIAYDGYMVVTDA